MSVIGIRVSRNFFGYLLKFLLALSYMGQWIFGLSPINTKCCTVYRLYVFGWCVGLCVAASMAIVNDIIGDEDTINGLVSTITFATYFCGHLVILVDSLKMVPYRKPLYEKFMKLQKILEEELQIPHRRDDISQRLSMFIIGFGCVVASVHGGIIWTAMQAKSQVTLLYWRSLYSYLALQSKTLEFLMVMVVLNYFVEILMDNLQKIGERNLKRVFGSPGHIKDKHCKFIKVWSLYQEQEDEQQVEILKSAYGDLYIQFQLLNRSYGWSLLASTAVYFVDFVCNTYWILLMVINHRGNYYALLQSVCFVMLAFTSLTLLCWLCAQANNKSRIIGCLISKLVKPLGNKRYNDLVSEFSIQTLHQRFVVTAKEFFSLNLGLLGSMVAAIVTYLVILIQFMFNEENSKEHNEITKFASKALKALNANTSISMQMQTTPVINEQN